MKDQLIGTAEALTMGDVSSDLSLFMGAVIDERAFGRHADALARASDRPAVSVLTGGGTDDSAGYFVQPTVLASTDPTDEIFTREYFGPILGVHVFDDRDYEAIVTQAADIAPYALTGSIIAQDRDAIARATETCGSRPAISTSTTSRRERSSGSSHSVVRGPAARTTRPGRSST